MKIVVFQIVLSVLVMAVCGCRTNVTSQGKRQSPIDINTRRLRRLRGIDELPLRILYAYADDRPVRVYKDNYTVKLVPQTISNRFLVFGGPLRRDIYNFNELHFHWGENNCEGSEHTVNGTRFSMEAHLVFYKMEYGSPQAAMNYSDGLVVIGVFIEAGGESNRNFQSITNLVNRSSASDEEFNTTAAEAYDWFLQSVEPGSKYFTYLGSLTTPPFTENVRWLVFGSVVPISSLQIEPFRRLTYQGRELTPNFRETQPLNSRRVFFSKYYDVISL